MLHAIQASRRPHSLQLLPLRRKAFHLVRPIGEESQHPLERDTCRCFVENGA